MGVAEFFGQVDLVDVEVVHLAQLGIPAETICAGVLYCAFGIERLPVAGFQCVVGWLQVIVLVLLAACAYLALANSYCFLRFWLLRVSGGAQPALLGSFAICVHARQRRVAARLVDVGAPVPAPAFLQQPHSVPGEVRVAKAVSLGDAPAQCIVLVAEAP
nr:hypothetical protein [Acidovorax sp.]